METSKGKKQHPSLGGVRVVYSVLSCCVQHAYRVHSRSSPVSNTVEQSVPMTCTVCRYALGIWPAASPGRIAIDFLPVLRPTRGKPRIQG